MTKIATAIETGTARDAATGLVRSVRQKLEGRTPKLVVAFTSTRQPLVDVLPAIARDFPDSVVLGASTAGEFTEAGDRKHASSIFALDGDFVVKAGFGTGLRANPEGAIEAALAGLPRDVAGYPHCTAILLLDPLAGNSEEATLIAAATLGPKVRIAGGAAGDDLLMERTYVGRGATVASDAVSIALVFSRHPLGMGVSHAHRPLPHAPVRVTRSEGNIVHELDGRPAFDVWREITRDAAKAAGVDVDKLSQADEGSYFLRFEGGLAAGAETFKVRAPLARSGASSIQFACGVPEGSVLHVMESTAERQIASARRAARLALDALDGRRAAGALVFDCICRNLILSTSFAEAVTGMSKELGGAPLAGFETYGEIALDEGDMSGFHNTSSVVLAFPE